MPDILQSIHIDAPLTKVRTSLATIDGLAAWWTRTTSGDAGPGGKIDFRFGEHVTQVRVDAAAPARVQWTVLNSNPDWDTTRMTFELEPVGDRTLLRFGHRGWREANAFFGHCSMKWATFLLSLRGELEAGEGRPFPDDIAI